MKKSYNIEVDCANCAFLMENEAKKVDGVASVSVSFMTQKMSIDFDDNADCDLVLKKIIKVCKKIERDFEIEL